MAWHYALPSWAKVYQNRLINQIFWTKKRPFCEGFLSHDMKRIRAATSASLAKAQAIVFNCVYLHQIRR